MMDEWSTAAPTKTAASGVWCRGFERSRMDMTRSGEKEVKARDLVPTYYRLQE
jgi:hypothetical protein